MFTRTTRAKRNIATVALAALVGSLLALSTPAGATGTAEAATDRLSGDNRYATAAAIAQDNRWDDMGNTVGGAGSTGVDIVVVNGENFPDGLAASALGHRILLTRADSVPAETAAALTALSAAAIDIDSLTVVGGQSVVSSAVMEELGTLAGVTPTRLSGADRYATALAVAQNVAGGVGASPANIVLATGANFPDALAAGPLALHLGTTTPVVLTAGGASLRADVAAFISSMNATGTVYIVGGEAAVPASILSEIQALGKNVKRLSGADRDATAAAVAAEIGVGDVKSAVLVNRAGFADALAAGPFAAQTRVDGAIMMVGADSVPAATAGAHTTHCVALGSEAQAAVGAGVTARPAVNGQIYAMGGTAVISEATLSAAGDASQCPALSATATYTSSTATTASTWLDGDGAWTTATTSPLITAGAGTATTGLAGNGWTLLFADSTTVDGAAITAAKTLTVSLTGDPDGVSQTAFVDRLNAIPEFAALFTATAQDTAIAATTNNAWSDITQNAATSGSTVNHVITLTFSQPVGDGTGAAFNTAPGDDAFTHEIGGALPTLSSRTPLAGAAVTGGSTVFTFTFNGSGTAFLSDDVLTVNSGAFIATAEQALGADLVVPITAAP